MRRQAKSMLSTQGTVVKRLPEFVIVGAMKFGTTTIQHQLMKHPSVYIPASELQLLIQKTLFEGPSMVLRSSLMLEISL